MSKGMKTQQLEKMPKSSVIRPVLINLRRYREIFGDSDEEVLYTVYQCTLSSVFCLCGLFVSFIYRIWLSSYLLISLACRKKTSMAFEQRIWVLRLIARFLSKTIWMAAKELAIEKMALAISIRDIRLVIRVKYPQLNPFSVKVTQRKQKVSHFPRPRAQMFTRSSIEKEIRTNEDSRELRLNSTRLVCHRMWNQQLKSGQILYRESRNLFNERAAIVTFRLTHTRSIYSHTAKRKRSLWQNNCWQRRRRASEFGSKKSSTW